MKKIWETGIILFSVMGFWGMIYPDLCFTEDVCVVSGKEAGNPERADGGGGEFFSGVGACGQEESGEDIFTRICKAKPGQIRIKSRFLEALASESEGKENGTGKE